MANESIGSRLAKFFDVSIQDELALTFNAPDKDKFFIFTTYPSFELITKDDTPLVPVALTVSFMARGNYIPGREIAVLGSSNTIRTPNISNTRGVISIQDAYILTGEPKSLLKTGTEINTEIPGEKENIRWTLLKRLYYPAIVFEGGKLIEPFLAENSDSGFNYGKYGFKPVGYNIADIFSNPASEFFNIPIGILVVALTKMGNEVTVRFYSSATLAQFMPQMGAVSNSGTVSVVGGGALTFSYKEEYPLSIEKVFGMNSGSEDKEFIDTLKKYLGAE